MTAIRIVLIFVVAIIWLSSIEVRADNTCRTFARSYQLMEKAQNRFTRRLKRADDMLTQKLQAFALENNKRKRFGNFVVNRPWYQHCDKDVLLLPLPIDRLQYPYFEVLSNNEVCVNQKKLTNACMPKNPTVYEFKLDDDDMWSLFLSSTILANSDASKLCT